MLVSRESIQALMPHQSLTNINSEPTHAAMKKLEKELAANLIAVHCPWGHGRGYLGELLPAALFQARYGAAYVPPIAAPPAYPVIPQGASTAQREELRATNEQALQHWQTMLHVRRIAVNLAANAIDEVYYAELDDPVEGLNNVEIQDIIDHIKERYCHIDQADLDTNLDRFNQGIDPSVPSSSTSENRRIAKSLLMMAMSTSQKQPWLPPEQNMPSNAVPLPTHGRNGIAYHVPIKHGSLGKPTGHVLSKNKKQSSASQTANSPQTPPPR